MTIITYPPRTSTFRTSAAALLIGIAWAAPLSSQQAPLADARSGVFVGSEFERYLRVLQVAGDAELYPWSIRSFAPHELRRALPGSTGHPWSERYDLAAEAPSGLRITMIQPESRTFYNSAFAYGANDGPVWVGRGLTSAVQAGFAAEYGPLSLRVAPIYFHAENRHFELMENGFTDQRKYGDGRFPMVIDQPQRFGEESYARLEPGESTIRLDVSGVALGVSTASQHWGPAVDVPLVLGNNAGGFSHIFLGTSSPVDLYLFRAHGRIVWGRLEQTPYSGAGSGFERRFMSGLVLVAEPRGLRGLEVGVGRFFHEHWGEEGIGLEHFLRPLESFLKSRLRDREDAPEGGTIEDFKARPDNQVASVFMRWTLPRSGLEFYGEFGKEDHNYDFRDFMLEPDHNSAYLLGLSKIFRGSASGYTVLRGEVVSSLINHTAMVRSQSPHFRHGSQRQGHTHRGQVLGGVGVYEGATSILALERYLPSGRWGVAWQRTVREDLSWFSRGRFWNDSFRDPSTLEATHALTAEALRFLGPLDVTAGLTGVWSLNHNFTGEDAFNLNARLGLRALF